MTDIYYYFFLLEFLLKFFIKKKKRYFMENIKKKLLEIDKIISNQLVKKFFCGYVNSKLNQMKSP